MTTKPIRRVAIIGTGVIGASWTALFLAHGLEVVATDVAPDAEAALKRFVEAAWPAPKRLRLSPGASQSKLTFKADIAAGVKGADLVQENGPERIDFKKKLYGQLDQLLPPDVIIASSSSGLTMSEIQSGCAAHPERCVIGHPFKSTPIDAAGRDRRRREDLRTDDPARHGILRRSRETAGPAAQGTAWTCRQSFAGRP
jgi:3-hydroxyacyl-CoA dehydrogenase